jgi:outer membrane receptor protein involved in Fe transport
MGQRIGVRLGLALLVAVAMAGPALAQNGGIKGKVARPDGSGLAGIAVIVNETGAVATTASNGSFSFSGLPAGTYSLSFSLGNNSESREGVEVAAGETADVAVTLDWNVSFLETITVFSASRREERIVDAPASVSTFTEEEIATDAVTGQLAKVIEFAPGVEVNQSGIYDYNINARGFNSSLNRRVQTLVDGREPSVPFLGSTDWPSLAAMNDVQSMELVRGPSSALYGANAFNGVLNVITRPARDVQGGTLTVSGGELSTLKADVLWGGELGREWYIKALGSYTEGEDFYQPRTGGTNEYPAFTPEDMVAIPNEVVAISNKYDNTTFTLRLDKAFGDTGLVTLEGSDYDGNGTTVVTGIGRVHIQSLQRQWARVNVSNQHFNVLAFHNARQSPDQIALSSGGRIFLDSTQDKVEVQGHTTFNDGKVRLVGGASYKEEDIDTANDSGVQTLLFDPVNADFSALFAQLDFDASDRVKVVVAARYDDSSLHDSRVSPKAAVVFGINDRNTLRLSYNEAFQVPNYSEFFLDAPTAIPGVGSSINLAGIEAALCTPFQITCGFGSPTQVRALGNKDLELEEIKSIELGYSGILNDKAYLTIDYYNNQLDNFITDLTANPFGMVNPNFGPYTPPPGHPAAATLLAVLQQNLGAAFAFLSNNVDGTPIFALASYANAGQVDTQGVDLGLNYYIRPEYQFDFSYSWFDFNIKDTGGFADSNLLPNAPEGKAAIGLTYTGDRFGWSVKGRWVDGFRWAAGAFQGPVPSYETFSGTLRYDATEAITVGLNVSNLFDDQHYESFGGDVLGRRALGYVTFDW